MRMYDDDEIEANSIISWIERRLEFSNTSYMVKMYQNQFKHMWIELFGDLESVPTTFKEKVESLYSGLLNKEKSTKI